MSRVTRVIGSCIILVFVLSAVLVCLSGQAWAGKKIAILLWTKENHYLESLNGIMDHLKKEGYGEPAVQFTTENAEGNKAQAAEIVKKISAAKPDLIITIGTSAASIVSRLVQDVPIVFSMVYDPVESGIIKDWKNSGNNVTGASNKGSMADLVKTLKEAAPVKTLAVLYEPRETNAVAQLKEIQAQQNPAQIKVVPVPITNKDDVNLIVPEAAAAVDAVFIAGSGILGEMIPEIVEIARKKRVVTVTHLSPRVEKGVLLGVCSNPFTVGVMAGERVIKILQGTKPSDIPIGTQDKFDIIINMRTARAGNIPIPAAFLKKADKVIAGTVRATTRIGILLWSDIQRYLDAQKGFQEALKNAGWAESSVTYTIESAGGNKALASFLAKKFAEAKLDLVLTMGTPMTVSAAKEIKKMPLVFTFVYDPVEANIAAGWKSSGNNTTGSSNKVSMPNILTMLRGLTPAKKIAVLYTPGEKNSEIQFMELREAGRNLKIDVIPVPLNNKDDAVRLLPEVVQVVDVIYLTGAVQVSEAIPTIMEIANRAKVVTVTHLEDLAEKGALLGIAANSYEMGRLAGEKAVQILNGASPSSIPIEPLTKVDVIINKKTVKSGNFQIPPAFLKTVTRVIE